MCIFVVGFIRGRVATVLTLIRIGVCALFGLVCGMGMALIIRRNGAQIRLCGQTCGCMVLGLARIHWSFNYEIEEFEF